LILLRQVSGLGWWGGLLAVLLAALAFSLIINLLLRGEEHFFQKAVKKMKKRSRSKQP
jgi:prolipoprotein diacylglyceryltransferase